MLSAASWSCFLACELEWYLGFCQRFFEGVGEVVEVVEELLFWHGSFE